MTVENDRLSKLEQRLTYLEDCEEIRNIINKYCHAVDRIDVDLLKSCYWPDGFDDHGFFGGNAMEFADFATKLLSSSTSTTHSCSNPIIEIEGNEAYVETQVDVVHRVNAEDDMVNEWVQCRYLDVFEKRDGEWRIHTRMPVIDGAFYFRIDPKIVGARLAGMELTALGARAPQDASYRLRELKQLAQVRKPMGDFWETLRAVGPMLR